MAAPSKVTEIATIDVCMVVMETTTEAYALDTASKISLEPQIETTEAVKLIVKGKLKAQKPEERTVTGNTITLTDNVFAPEEVKVLQGGTIVNAINYIYSAGSSGASSGDYYINAGSKYISFTLEDDLQSGDTITYCDIGSLELSRDGLITHLEYTESSSVPSSGSSLSVTSSTDTTRIKSYTPPTVGSGTKGDIFRLSVYSAQYNTAGQIVQYEKITYPNCQGVPVAFSSEDGVFRSSEYTINSFPKPNEPPYYIEYVNSLPELS